MSPRNRDGGADGGRDARGEKKELALLRADRACNRPVLRGRENKEKDSTHQRASLRDNGLRPADRREWTTTWKKRRRRRRE